MAGHCALVACTLCCPCYPRVLIPPPFSTLTQLSLSLSVSLTDSLTHSLTHSQSDTPLYLVSFFAFSIFHINCVFINIMQLNYKQTTMEKCTKKSNKKIIISLYSI